jgi:hypothetical protein
LLFYIFLSHGNEKKEKKMKKGGMLCPVHKHLLKTSLQKFCGLHLELVDCVAMIVSLLPRLFSFLHHWQDIYGHDYEQHRGCLIRNSNRLTIHEHRGQPSVFRSAPYCSSSFLYCVFCSVSLGCPSVIVSSDFSCIYLYIIYFF